MYLTDSRGILHRVARDGLAVASYACEPDLSSALGEYASRRMREALRVSAAAAHSVLETP